MSAKVYADYDPTEVPPHPGKDWTRFVCISDTHSKWGFFVPPGDILLHSGDLSRGGTYKRLLVTVEWLMQLPHPVKVLIAGNHDVCLDTNRREYDPTATSMIRSQQAKDSGIWYLEHESLVVPSATGRSWKIYGTPAVPRFSDGAFQYVRASEATAIFSRIPEDTEILLTHTPPYKILDQTLSGKNAGCQCLAARLRELKSCRLHAFGHIHDARGAMFGTEGEYFRSSNEDACVAVNGARSHRYVPIIVDLKN